MTALRVHDTSATLGTWPPRCAHASVWNVYIHRRDRTHCWTLNVYFHVIVFRSISSRFAQLASFAREKCLCCAGKVRWRSQRATDEGGWGLHGCKRLHGRNGPTLKCLMCCAFVLHAAGPRESLAKCPTTAHAACDSAVTATSTLAHRRALLQPSLFGRGEVIARGRQLRDQQGTRNPHAREVSSAQTRRGYRSRL